LKRRDWTPTEERRLLAAADSGVGIVELARRFGTNPTSISIKLRELRDRQKQAESRVTA
jgi:transposase-like protein